jgi:hypothetical protein
MRTTIIRLIDDINFIYAAWLRDPRSAEVDHAIRPHREEWALLEPLMPKSRKSARVDDRKVMNAIFYVLRTGAATGGRRMSAWAEATVIGLTPPMEKTGFECHSGAPKRSVGAPQYRSIIARNTIVRDMPRRKTLLKSPALAP